LRQRMFDSVKKEEENYKEKLTHQFKEESKRVDALKAEKEKEG